MSLIECPICNKEFDGSKIPFCPKCLATQWKNTNTFIRKKHDPRSPPKPEPSYRSVLSWEFIDNIDQFTEYAAQNGTWYFSRKHEKYCHFTDTCMYSIPGSGIRAGDPMPDHSLDGLLVADADVNAHAYAVDIETFKSEIDAGNYTPLPLCDQQGCDNKVYPGKSKCILHTT